MWEGEHAFEACFKALFGVPSRLGGRVPRKFVRALKLSHDRDPTNVRFQDPRILRNPSPRTP